jgi:MYXO-CTERM domain-containing protein
MTNLYHTGVAVATVLFASSAASAITMRFGGVSMSNESNSSTGEQQLTLDVFDSTGGERDYGSFVSFLIQNTGSATSTVTQVLFDDFFVNEGPFRSSPVLGGVNFVENGPGVSFLQTFSGAGLPGSENWTTDYEFTAGTPARSIPEGIDPGEFLLIEFQLAEGMTFQDMLDALATEDLRIGLIAKFGDGEFESFSTDPSTVPLPGGALLALGGLGAVASRRNRR